MNKKLIIGLAVVFILAVAAYFAFFHKKKEAPKPEEKPSETAAKETGGSKPLPKPVPGGSVAIRPGVLAGGGKAVSEVVGGRPGAVLAGQGRG